jgi:hypothetical protein
MKAQASVETLTTLGMVIAFTAPVLFLLLSASQYGAEGTAIYQAQSSSRIIADTINDVFVQGEGATKKILVNLPGNTETIEVSVKEVVITLNVQSGPYHAVSPVFAEISPLTVNQQIGEVRGMIPITVKNIDGKIEVYKNG